MDVNNSGPSDLHLHLLFEDFGGMGPPLNLALSADAIIVPANSGWQAVSFDVTPGGLIQGLFGTVSGALMGRTRFGFFTTLMPNSVVLMWARPW